MRLSHLLAVGAALGMLPPGVTPPRLWGRGDEEREPRAQTAADRERIARAEAKRARKAAKRGAT